MIGDPLIRFQAEHQTALAALDRLETAAWGLRAEGSDAPHLGAAREVLALLQGAVREHNEAEEQALFPLLGAAAPLEPFLEEHQNLWRLEGSLERAIDQADGARTADVALEIVDLLRAHIRREDDVLFPMARELLGAEGLTAVARRLDRSG